LPSATERRRQFWPPNQGSYDPGHRADESHDDRHQSREAVAGSDLSARLFVGSERLPSPSSDASVEDFGLTWNAPLEGGGLMVGNTIRIEIEAEAVRKSSE
jgi:hypothetical protein